MLMPSLGIFEVGSPEWTEARRGRLGGSEIASVVGLSPYKSKHALWLEKAGLVEPDHLESFKLWFGNAVEPVIVQSFERQTGLHTRNTRQMFTSIERPYQVAEPDRFIVEPPRHTPIAILECKTADSGDAWQWGADGTDIIPDGYRCQVLWYLDVLDLPVAYVHAIIGARTARTYEIRRSDDDIAFLRREGEAFIRSVEEGTPPDIDGSDSTYQAIRKRHPKIDGSTVEIDTALADMFAAAKAVYDNAGGEWNRAKSLMLDAMGSAQYAETNGIRVADRRAKGDEGTPYVQAARGLNRIRKMEETE